MAMCQLVGIAWRPVTALCNSTSAQYTVTDGELLDVAMIAASQKSAEKWNALFDADWA